MKLAKLPLLLLLLASPLSANPFCCDCDPCSPFDGFYVGVAGGLSINHADTKTKSKADYLLQDNGFAPFISLKSHEELYDHSGWGEVFVGYGMQCNCFYLGGRFGVNFSDFSPSGKVAAKNFIPLVSQEEGATSLLINKIETELRNVEYTLDFKPGWVFCDRTMLFGIIGAAFNEEELKGKTLFIYENDVQVGNTTISDGFGKLRAHKKETSTGFRAGLGIEHMISRCMSLQLSYVYTDYWSLHKKAEGVYEVGFQIGTGTPVINEVPFEALFKTEAHRHVFSLGLAYYF